MSPTVSIVIRALNEAPHIGRLLASIAAQTVTADEVILVDSGSVDRTVEIAEQFECKVLHMPPREFTFGRSLNWGCASAKGDVLVFVSAHVYPLQPDWLAKLLAPFEHEQVGLSYGGQTGDHRSNFAEIQLLKRWFPDTGTLNQEDPFCNNANCAVRRTLWEDNPYDESLPGLEDLAFAREIQALGHRIAYVPDARIAHVHEEGIRQTLNRYRREAMAYNHIFGGTDMTLPKAIRLALTNIGTDTVTAVRQREFAQLLPAAGFRIAQFSGAYLGQRTAKESTNQVVRRMYYPRG